MRHHAVEPLLVQRIGLQSPECADSLGRAERSVAVAVVQESRPLVPEMFVHIGAQPLHLVLHILDLLPAFDIETDVQQRLVYQHLLQVGVEPDHMSVRKDRVVFGLLAGHVVHARSPAARPIGAVGPRAVEPPPFGVGAQRGEDLVQAVDIAELAVVRQLDPRQHAAGTGRFLEMMARSLEISIDELGPVSLQSKENIEISSMCSVFAESEVISLIAQNKEIADIAHGIHKAIAGKAMSLLKRVGLNPGYMMTGGVAKNPGVVAVLEEQLGEKLHIYEEPEIVGALGAALYGLEEIL